jgi:hypothetical protein
MRQSVRELFRVAGLAAVILPVGGWLTGAFAKTGATSPGAVLLALGGWYCVMLYYLPLIHLFWQFAKSPLRSPEGGPGGRMMYVTATRMLPLTVIGGWAWATESPPPESGGAWPNLAWHFALPAASVYTAMVIAGMVARRSVQRHGGRMLTTIREFRLRSWRSSLRQRFSSKAGDPPAEGLAAAGINLPPDPAAERIRPAEHYGRFASWLAFWFDVAGALAMQAMCIIFGFLLASGVSASIAGIASGWGSPLSLVVPWTAKEGVQVFLGLWLIQGTSRALTEGLRDYELPRTGVFVLLTVPPLLVLLVGVWHHGLISGAITNLVLVVAVGLWTPAPPEATFGTLTAAKALVPKDRFKGMASGVGGAFTWPVRRVKRWLAGPRQGRRPS